MLTVTITIDQKVDTEVIKVTNIIECLGADNKGYVIVVNVKRDFDVRWNYFIQFQEYKNGHNHSQGVYQSFYVDFKCTQS